MSFHYHIFFGSKRYSKYAQLSLGEAGQTATIKNFKIDNHWIVQKIANDLKNFGTDIKNKLCC